MDLISSPKQTPVSGRTSDYYAGFSSVFVEDIFNYLGVSKGQVVLDPWNGFGTTTSVALSRGVKSLGVDINPIAVVVARSRQGIKYTNARFIIKRIRNNFIKHCSPDVRSDDPLPVFYTDGAVKFIRRITDVLEKEFSCSLSVSLAKPEILPVEFCIAISCLFRVIKRESVNLKSSNLAWIKVPKDKKDREGLRGKGLILESFLKSLEKELVLAVDRRKKNLPGLSLGNAEQLFKGGSVEVDFVITSPPYLTRIDYIVSTYIELSIIGMSFSEIQLLRKLLTGTPCINSFDQSIIPSYCQRLLRKIAKHSSYSSSDYYKKFFTQYFHSMSKSITSIDFHTKEKGKIVFVVQDSFYKEIQVKMDKILNAYADLVGWELISRVKFLAKSNMINVNTISSKYRDCNKTYEYVLVFEKKRFN